MIASHPRTNSLGSKGDRMKAALISALAIAAYAVPASATETITYTYDAKGRVVQVTHTGTVNNNVQTTYSHDKADNRTNVTTTGAP